MVLVTEFVWVFLMEFGGEREIWMDLEWEGLAEGKDLFSSAPLLLVVIEVVQTFGRNGISGPHRSKTDLPTSWGFLFRYSPKCSPEESR